MDAGFSPCATRSVMDHRSLEVEEKAEASRNPGRKMNWPGDSEAKDPGQRSSRRAVRSCSRSMILYSKRRLRKR